MQQLKEADMGADQDSGDKKIIPVDKAAEILFNDSTKNFSELKTRQWNATHLSVLALVGLATVAHGAKGNIQMWIIVLMVFVLGCHLEVIRKCESNLKVLRERIKDLITNQFSPEALQFFKGPDGVRSAVVDEGRITFMLFMSTPITFVGALLYLWPSLCTNVAS